MLPVFSSTYRRAGPRKKPSPSCQKDLRQTGPADDIIGVPQVGSASGRTVKPHLVTGIALAIHLVARCLGDGRALAVIVGMRLVLVFSRLFAEKLFINTYQLLRVVFVDPRSW